MAASAVPIDGFCDPAFERVREAFRENFDQFDEVGAAVAVYIGGRQVLDLWGGWRDEAKTRPWEKNTLVNAYSVGKGITAILVLALVGQRRLDPDQAVTAVWPEFGAAGKDKITLRQILAHQGGLPALREELPDEALSDWQRITASLAAQEPFWEPGTAHGYHVNTHGFLTGEMARRASGAPSFRRALREVLTQSLDAEFHIGLPLYAHRLCADIIGVMARPIDIAHARKFVAPPSGDPATDEMKFKAYFNPSAITGQGVVNSSWWRSLQIPSTNGHGTARGVARIYAAALDGSLFPQSVLDDACTPQVDGLDRILDRPTRFGLGFQLAQDSRPIGPNARSFGHFGYGGSLGFADPDTGLAFAYVMNRPGERWQSPRAGALIDAAYACL
ncbi:MAG: serine hydrolase domain-containing protein [Deltaproteobacteria bacterium]